MENYNFPYFGWGDDHGWLDLNRWITTSSRLCLDFWPYLLSNWYTQFFISFSAESCGQRQYTRVWPCGQVGRSSSVVETSASQLSHRGRGKQDCKSFQQNVSLWYTAHQVPQASCRAKSPWRIAKSKKINKHCHWKT